jgi:hypothetical protein
MQKHCVYAPDGTERPGHFDSCEVGGRFGKPLKLRAPRAGLLRFIWPMAKSAQARRSEIDIVRLAEHFGFAVAAGNQWDEPQTFDEAQSLIEAVPGDPLITAVDYHV